MPLRIRIADNIKTKELYENVAGGDCDQQTLISYFKQDGKITFIFNCVEDTPIIFGNKDNDKLYKGDVVEIMLTLGNANRYLEVSVNPAELKYAAIVLNPDGEGSNLTIETLDDNPIETDMFATDIGYVAKIIIPIDWLKELGWRAEASLINIYRQDFNAEGDLRLYALSPTKSATFHKVDAFIPMEIL